MDFSKTLMRGASGSSIVMNLVGTRTFNYSTTGLGGLNFTVSPAIGAVQGDITFGMIHSFANSNSANVTNNNVTTAMRELGKHSTASGSSETQSLLLLRRVGSEGSGETYEYNQSYVDIGFSPSRQIRINVVTLRPSEIITSCSRLTDVDSLSVITGTNLDGPVIPAATFSSTSGGGSPAATWSSTNSTFVLRLWNMLSNRFDVSSLSNVYSGTKRYTRFNYAPDTANLISASAVNNNQITIPSHQTGDDIYLVVATAVNTTVSVPTGFGWSSYGSTSRTDNGGNTWRLYLYRKTAASDSEASGIFSNATRLICFVLRNVDQRSSMVIGTSNSWSNLQNSANVNFPIEYIPSSISTNQTFYDRTLTSLGFRVALHSTATNLNSVIPSGMSLVTHTGTGPQIALYMTSDKVATLASTSVTTNATGASIGGTFLVRKE